MRSLDTNIILRAVLHDDAVQTPIAVRLLNEDALIVPTVILELVWVLKTRVGWPPHRIVATLDDLMAIANVFVLEADAVEWAAARYAAGADFADMFHLALSAGATCFATFDRGIAHHADGGVVRVETPG